MNDEGVRSLGGEHPSAISVGGDDADGAGDG